MAAAMSSGRTPRFAVRDRAPRAPVGGGHEDALVVAELGDVELLRADARPQGRDQQADLLVGQDLVVARLLGVDDLATEREHRLGAALPALLGRAPGRVALHEEELPEGWLALRAVGQLAGQRLRGGPPPSGGLPRA